MYKHSSQHPVLQPFQSTLFHHGEITKFHTQIKQVTLRLCVLNSTVAVVQEHVNFATHLCAICTLHFCPTYYSLRHYTYLVFFCGLF